MKTLLAATALSLLAAGAQAADIKALPDINTITLNGSIDAGDAKPFHDAVMKLDPTRPVILQLNSPGGHLVATTDMISMTDEFKKINPSLEFRTYVAEDAECASACTLLWASTNVRYVALGAKFYVHAVMRVSADKDTPKIDEDMGAQAWTLQMLRYYRNTGAPASVLEKALDVNPDGVLLGYPELAQWKATFLAADDHHQYKWCDKVADEPLAIRCGD
jgi:hypothetical protein